MINAIKQVWILTFIQFKKWSYHPQILFSFSLGFVACFLLTDKSVHFAAEHDTALQMLEPFIWTFGDAKSVFLLSLCLLVLFGDSPDMSPDVYFRLIRTTRVRWMAAQILYMVIATFLFTAFILLSSCILSARYSFYANQWSETAAILGYSSIGNSLAIPSYVKVLELTFPYQCTLHVFLLMLGNSMLLSSIIFFFNLLKARLGIIAGIIYSGFGMILTPEMIQKCFHISIFQTNKANILFGWLSPLNHATYYMHSFGYDNLPKLSTSYLYFIILSFMMFIFSFIKSKTYSFTFTGTERSL